MKLYDDLQLWNLELSWNLFFVQLTSAVLKISIKPNCSLFIDDVTPRINGSRMLSGVVGIAEATPFGVSTPNGVGTFRKENEKKRSKCNRDKFKQYMEELNEAMGFKKLSINKCLSTAVSLLKLSKFCDRFPSENESISPSMFYEVGNYLGLAFDENGRVLHITHKMSEHPLPFNMCQVGSFLNQICFNMEEIIHRVFIQGSPCMNMKLKYSKKNKQPTSMFFRGKVMFNTASQVKMFIGYGCIQDKRDTIRDPFMFNTGFEVWIDSNYDVIKSHSWLELLLEENVKHQRLGRINLFSLLHPDDINIIEQCELQMKNQGFFKVSCRVYDGENYLWVTARGYPQKKGTPDRYAEVYVWPFAYEDFKTGDMYLVDVKKLWSKKQKRGKIFKAAREKFSMTNLASPEHLENSGDELMLSRKRPRSDGESSASESCGESPKRMAVDYGMSSPDASVHDPIRPTPKRLSAFQSRSGAFVPVAGCLPIIKPADDVQERLVRLEPMIIKSSDYLTYPASPEVSSSGSRTPDSETHGPRSPDPSLQDESLDKSSSHNDIVRLMQMNAVFKELKDTNVGLFHKFADVMDPGTQSDGLLSLIPLMLKLQEKDLIEGLVAF